jgi:membrane protein DedA with SNARE-associated domain
VDGFLDGPWAYVVLVLAALTENSVGVGLFLPVETLILAAASLCAVGKLSAPGVILVILGGALVGDSIGYLVGRRFGPAITRRLDGHLGVTDERIAQTRRVFTRWGMWAVAIGRMIPVVRFLVVLLAGDMGLPYRRFLVADVIGTVVWLGVHFSLGYALGSSVDALGGTHDLLLIVAGVSIAGVVGALALHWLWRRRATRAAVRARV